MYNRCYMCEKRRKKCAITFCFLIQTLVVCGSFFFLFDVHWALHLMVRGVLLSLRGTFIHGKGMGKKLEVVPLCIFFIIWRDRNKREPFKFVKLMINFLKGPFCIYFGIGLDCELGITPCHCQILVGW